jgi:hypothetical protein
MRRNFAFALVLAAVVTGCGIADFDIEQPLVEQHVDGSGIPGPLAALFPCPTTALACSPSTRCNRRGSDAAEFLNDLGGAGQS